MSDQHQQQQQQQASSLVPKSASIDVATIGSETQSTIVPSLEEEPIRVMLLCGSDLLQSFEKPNLWKPEDVSFLIF